MDNQSISGFEPTKDEGNLLEEHFKTEEEYFVLSAEYVALEGEFVLWNEELGLPPGRKPVKETSSTEYFEGELLVTEEEYELQMAESFTGW